MDIVVSSVLIGLILLLFKNIYGRMGKIEDTHKNFMPKDDIREFVEDKVGGIRTDVKEIRDKIEKLFDLYISDHVKKTH